MATRLELRSLTVKFPTVRGWIRPVNEVSLCLDGAETLGIVGESGSGKTMLSLALMGLEPPGARCEGDAWLRTQPGSRNLIGMTREELRMIRGRDISMIFQEPMTALDPVIRVGRQIAEAIRVHEPRLTARELNERVVHALERAAVPQPALRARQYPHQLSGGLRQRVMIAMALAAGPSVLIADEPTTALDVTVQKQILELLDHLRAELRLSMLFITHDLGVIAQVADRVAVMYAGRIVEEGPVLEVLRHPQHPYTEGLLRAAPRLRAGKTQPIAGTVPALHDLPLGCTFAPRCDRRRSKCESSLPQLLPSGAGHFARCLLVQEPERPKPKKHGVTKSEN